MAPMALMNLLVVAMMLHICASQSLGGNTCSETLSLQDAKCGANLGITEEINPALQRSLPIDMPARWKARVRITQHQVDPGLVYPPRLIELMVHIDQNQHQARIETLQGENQGQVFLRHYDPEEGFEYRFYENRCERAFLNVAWPKAQWPQQVKYLGKNHWVDAQKTAVSREAVGVERVHFYSEPGDGFVSKCEVEFVREVPEIGEIIEPLTTYELLDVRIPSPDTAQEWDLGVDTQLASLGLSRSDCYLHGSGWPYTSLLHTYIQV